jgi:hypothetical protein
MLNNQNIKDKAVFFGWIFLFLFLITLLWSLSQPLLKHNLLRAVNNILIASNDSRRITDFSGKEAGGTNPLGFWYSMHTSSEKMFVFAVFQDGVLVPLGAIVSDNGKVVEVIPLSAHAVNVMDKLHEGLLQIYITRIEAAYHAVMEGYK